MTQAILLCAGYATRMGALTARFPKALLPVAGRAILDDLVDQLVGTRRFERLVVVTNHRDHDPFVAWRDARAQSADGVDGPEIRLVDDGTTSNESRLGAIGDLALAIEVTRAKGPLLVAAGDNLFRFDLAAYLEDCARAESSMVLLGHEPDPARLRRSGVAEVATDGRLLRLWEKPEHPASELVCPPLYWLAEDALAEIGPCRAARPEADAPGHLIAWLAERVVVRTHRMRGARLDVGDAESYRAAESWLRSHSG